MAGEVGALGVAFERPASKCFKCVSRTFDEVFQELGAEKKLIQMKYHELSAFEILQIESKYGQVTISMVQVTI